MTAPATAPDVTVPARRLRPDQQTLNTHYSWNSTPGLESKSWAERQR